MSIIGSFVGALVALAVRAKPEEDETLLARIEQLTRERDRQYEENIAQIAKYAALWRERDLWREEALRLRHNQPLPLGGQHAVNDWEQLGQAAQNLLHQQSQQQMAQAQAQQLQQMAVYQGLMGAQAQNWPHCDCSPSRAWGLTGVIPGA